MVLIFKMFILTVINAFTAEQVNILSDNPGNVPEILWGKPVVHAPKVKK